MSFKEYFKSYLKNTDLRNTEYENQSTSVDCINEAKGDMLDISIPAAGKWLTSEKRKQEFLTSQVIVEMKSDGTKISAYKKASTGNFEKDWIIAYKGNIFYDSEFNFASDNQIKQSSIGAAQFKFVLEQFKKVVKQAKSIPTGTELFIEYIMKKPTLMSDYKRNHKMILIGYTTSTYDRKKAKLGKLLTKPGPMETIKRSEYAELLGIDEPMVIFEGVLSSKISFEKGIKNKQLKQIYQEFAPAMHWDNPDLLIDDLRQMFLAVESKYGGKEEGVVLFILGPGSFDYKGKSVQVILKFQQEYQLSREERNKKKAQFKEDDFETENSYWDNVQLVSRDIVNQISKSGLNKPLKELLKESSLLLKNYKITFSHSKKDIVKIKDDIQLTIKQLILKRLPGNNNGLIIGRFQPFTLGHKKMIDTALEQCDNVYICIIKGKKSEKEKNPLPLELQEEMIKDVYKSIYNKRLFIISAQTGNLITIINKTKDNINYVYAGTDRVQAYKKQLERTLDINVREIKRTDEDISATQVRNAIKEDDYDTFKRLVPRAIVKFWSVLKKYIVEQN